MTLRNATRNVTLASRVRRCDSFFTRLRGLLGTKQLPGEEACWISPCRAVHTFGMKYALDVYFLDKNGKVVAVETGIRPNRLSAVHSGAASVVEFAAGFPRVCIIGDKMEFISDAA